MARILIVEDDPDIAELIRHALEKAGHTVRAMGLQDNLADLRTEIAEWKPEIVQTIATKGEGIDELWAAIGKHREYQESNGLLTSRRRRRRRIATPMSGS